MASRTALFLSLAILLCIPACFRDPYLRYQERVLPYMEPPAYDESFYDPPVVSAPIPPPVMPEVVYTYPPVVMESESPPAPFEDFQPCPGASCPDCNGRPAIVIIEAAVHRPEIREYRMHRLPGVQGPGAGTPSREPRPAFDPFPDHARPGAEPRTPTRFHDPSADSGDRRQPPVRDARPGDRAAGPQTGQPPVSRRPPRDPAMGPRNSGQPPAREAQPRNPSPEPSKAQPPARPARPTSPASEPRKHERGKR
jgi:hypothetical protein